jgi:hypothetical protein
MGLLFSASSFARSPIQVQVDQAVPQGRFQLGVGSHLTINVPNSDGTAGKNVDGLFLGRIIEPAGTFSKYMLLDLEQTRVYLADRDDVAMGTDYTYQPILKQYDQIGGTCTGYAIDHILQQLYWSGFQGNGQLKDTLSSEKGRTQLLVDTINEYYLALQHKYSVLGVMKKFGERFGFKCEMKTFKDTGSAQIYLLSKMGGGLPVMISFSTGVNMVSSSYEITDYEDQSPMKDRRLWIPRKIGERNTGGHTVVAASMFESKGRQKLLMLDSDWAEPRIWDVDNYLGDKAAISEVEFISCQ